ncbi:MAG: DegT/DnrJ/EryC1/StrS family aminotransferase [Candidatus Obscuribacterales bacterium]|nr:DegT/DnrJ/EryC1/StrS family aminotransferase [Candidatus Obscuribacterales bacterium]
MVLNVPFGDMKVHYRAIQKEIDEAVQRVIASGYYILGPELETFEKQFAQFLGANYVVGCASGTEAIYLALAAFGVGPGDEVLVVAHTAVPTISAISMTGAEPVFVDIDPKSYVMDVNKVTAKLSAKTKAIVPVHLYGQMVDMEPLLALAKSKGIPVLEDVAQATGATYKSKQAGTMAECGAFSFYPSKNLGAFGDGGAVCTNSKEIYEQLLMLRNYGQSKRYYHDQIGINSRLDEIQAAILAAQLPFLSGWNKRRHEIAQKYTQGLKDLVITPHEEAGRNHVYHLYVIQNNDREGLQKYLADQGIGTLIHYPVPAHLQKAYSYRGYKAGDLPVTEEMTQRILSLPMYPELTDAQVDYVIEQVRNFHLQNPQAQLVCSSSERASNMALQSR